MSEIGLNLQVPKGGFYRRAKAFKLSVRDLSVFHDSPVIRGPFLSYIKRGNPGELKVDFPAVYKAVEVARSSEYGYSRLVKAVEYALSFGGPELSGTTLCAMLLSEAPSCETRYLRKIFTADGASTGYWNAMLSALKTLRRAKGLPFSIVRLDSPSAVIDYHSLMRRIFSGSWESLVSDEILLAHFGLEFARAEYVIGYRGRDENLVRHLLLGLAPLAERSEFFRFSEAFKNAALRSITGSMEYLENERNLRLNARANAQNLLAGLKELLEEQLAEVFPAGVVKSVKSRLKGAYSIYEKQEVKTTVLEDRIGVEIIVSDLDALWKTVSLLKNAKGLSKPTRENLRKFPWVHIGIKDGLVRVEKDDINKPREGGFSAYTLLLVYGDGYPVEIQVTTPERARKNRKWEAPHWKYKLERSLKFLKIEHEQDLSSPEPGDNERLVLLSETNPSFPDYVSNRWHPVMWGLPEQKVDILTGSTISRVPGNLRQLADLETRSGKKANVFEVRFDHEYARPGIIPARSKSNRLIRDGMIIALAR